MEGCASCCVTMHTVHDCTHGFGCLTAKSYGMTCSFSVGFLLFGEDAGDSIGPRADNNVTSSIRLSEPIVYFREEYDTVFVSLFF